MVSRPTQEIYLKDYKAPDFFIESTFLEFDLYDSYTKVTSVLQFSRNGQHANALVLDGQELVLKTVELDGMPLSEQQYRSDADSLTIPSVPDRFELRVVVEIKPQENTSLEGLYRSRTMFCTQCEAEGFRKITYYLDRPDVLSVFTTKVIADQDKYPVLLSNGNLLEGETLAEGRHTTTWLDPFPKPSYLFALVAGELSCVSDVFKTMSGRNVDIKLYVEEKDLDKCEHAIESLKNAMIWDEKVYGREYDLDTYMIVAVDDFNMGAMENKGLNIFNTSCVLANSDTTTDAGFQRVEAVVAHEYFHNWSGNRVTCRDWFQLSLKEGFTVFRDAEFSADMGSRTVKRVEDVQMLRTNQFAEDGGPMAHPVRPASFIEIANFYTLTVYEKGAEVVRMLHTLLGADKFRKGSDLYFDRHDGQAVTVEDFVQAMSDASARDLQQFMYWYQQAGTPVLKVSDAYDAELREYTLTISQSCPTTPEATSEQKKPLHIPFAMGLLGEAGALRLQLVGAEERSDTSDNTHTVLELTKAEESFVFSDVPEHPVPSLLRGFSAPVKLDYQYSSGDLMRIMSMDDDGFSRWDAAQKLAIQALNGLIESKDDVHNVEAATLLVKGYKHLLSDAQADPAMVSLMMDLPSEAYLGELQDVVKVDANHAARNSLTLKVAQSLKDTLLAVYKRCTTQLHGLEHAVSSDAIALRSLKNCTLHYLMHLSDAQIHEICLQQIDQANNMTEVSAALTFLVNCDDQSVASKKETALKAFYERWQSESLVVNQWLLMQAKSPASNALETVKRLMASPVFDITNPNKVRSLIGVFASQNLVNFHNESGEGYRFLADQILVLNKQNPQVASRLVTPLTKWKRHDADRQKLMKEQLQRIVAEEDLSKDVYEVVSKSLV